MNVVLKQSGNKVGLYIDNNQSTVFEGSSIEDVLKWINRNLLNAKVHIIK